MKRLLLASAVFTLFSTSIFALSGQWNGKLKLGPNELTLRLNILQDTAGKDKCTFDSPDQGAYNIPADILFLSADSISVNIEPIKATVTGKINNDTINAELIQSGFKLPITFIKSESIIDSAPKRTQIPQPPFPYSEKEITFTNPADGAILSGTLTIPDNPQIGFPAVLLVTGSGLQNRDEEVMGHKPFLILADYLARNGIASLRYDDRGYEKSTGDNSSATTETFFCDAIAGIKALKQTPSIGKVGILGHSEGGTIAFMAGATGDVDFVVSLAGTAIPGDSILVKQNRAMLLNSPTTAVFANGYCNLLSDILSHLKTRGCNMEENEAKQLIADMIKKNGYYIPAQATENIVAIATQSNSWIHYFIKYNPADDIKNLHCPVFALNGTKDTQVEAASNLESIRNNLPNDNRYTENISSETKSSVIREYPGLNHLFQHCNTGAVSEYANIPETVSPEVLSDIALWINNIASRQGL